MPLEWLEPVEVTPGSADAWTDVDLSAYLPAGATGAVFHVVNTYASSQYAFGVRKNGSTDDRHGNLRALSHAYAMSGVDANRVCEAYVGHTTQVDLYLIGYTSDGFVFFDNAIDKSLTSYAAWTDIDCSANAPNAVGLMFDVASALTRQFGFRANGSTDDRHYDMAASGHCCPTALIGCDAGQVIEGYAETSAVDFFLLGYITADASITLNTNATDLSLGATGAWTDLAALPGGATGAIVEVVSSGFYDYGLRANGSAEEIYGDTDVHNWVFVPCDENGIVEGKIENTGVDFFLVGYTTVPGGDELTATPLDVVVEFGAASLEVGLTATPLDVVITFGAASLGESLGPATPLVIVVTFGAATLQEIPVLVATPLDVGIVFGGAQLREIRTGEHDPTAPPLAFSEPLELRSSAGVLVRLLPLAAKVRIRQKVNSLDVLTFDYPRQDGSFEDLEQGCLVRWRGQDYRIVDVDDGRDIGGLSGSVLAEQWFIKLGDTLNKDVALEEATAREAVVEVLTGTGWTAGAVQPPGTYSFSDRWKSPLALLMQIADIWNGELEFNTATKKVNLLTERGMDLHASLIYRKNVVGLTRKRSASKLYNRVWFEGKDGLTSLSGYVQDALSIAAHGRRDYFWGDSSITTLKTLIYGATLRLKAYREPRITYDCSAFNFEPLAGGASWLTAELGDRVKVYDEELGINASLRVFEREWAPFEPAEPDRVRLSSDREWFPNLSEKLAEVQDPTNEAQPKPGEGACKGEGGYAWIDAVGVPAEWQTSGRPHIWTSYWDYGGVLGLPHFVDGLWHSGYDGDKDGVQDTGPLGDGATWETADWEPHGFDLDCDGIEDFWPFGGAGSYGVPGGHCYNFDEVPEVWDYADGDVPYKAVDTIPDALWYDVSPYSFYGWDRNANGVPDGWYDIADMPCPLTFTRGELLLGLDLGGGAIQWVPANPPILPMWHSKARADVQDIYCTGWTGPDENHYGAGQRNFSGPIQHQDGSWDPAPYDSNDDGFADFWAYGGWWSFGHEIGSDGLYSSDQAVAVAACGATAPSVGPLAPDLPPPGGLDCAECGTLDDSESSFDGEDALLVDTAGISFPSSAVIHTADGGIYIEATDTISGGITLRSAGTITLEGEDDVMIDGGGGGVYLGGDGEIVQINQNSGLRLYGHAAVGDVVGNNCLFAVGGVLKWRDADGVVKDVVLS